MVVNAGGRYINTKNVNYYELRHSRWAGEFIEIHFNDGARIEVSGDKQYLKSVMDSLKEGIDKC